MKLKYEQSITLWCIIDAKGNILKKTISRCAAWSWDNAYHEYDFYLYFNQDRWIKEKRKQGFKAVKGQFKI